MLKKFLNFRYVEPQEFFVLEIAEEVVKINLFANGKENFLREINCTWESFSQENFSAESRTFFSQEVERIILEENLQQVRYAAVKFSDKFIFTEQLILPQLPDKELKQVMFWEQQHYLPWEMETCYSTYVKQELREQHQEILLLAVQKEVVQFWKNLLRGAGFVLFAITLSGEEYPYKINLLPNSQEVLRKPLTKFYKMGTVACAVLILASLGGAWLALWRSEANLAQVQEQLAGMSGWQQRYELYQKQSAEITKLQAQIKTLEQERLLWSAVLAEIMKSLPAECWLTSIKQQDNLMIEVQGKTVDVKQLQQFSESLEKSFAKVQLQNTGAEKDGTGYTILLTRGKKA